MWCFRFAGRPCFQNALSAVMCIFGLVSRLQSVSAERRLKELSHRGPRVALDFASLLTSVARSIPLFKDLNINRASQAPNGSLMFTYDFDVVCIGAT